MYSNLSRYIHYNKIIKNKKSLSRIELLLIFIDLKISTYISIYNNININNIKSLYITLLSVVNYSHSIKDINHTQYKILIYKLKEFYKYFNNHK